MSVSVRVVTSFNHSIELCGTITFLYHVNIFNTNFFFILNKGFEKKRITKKQSLCVLLSTFCLLAPLCQSSQL